MYDNFRASCPAFSIRNPVASSSGVPNFPPAAPVIINSRATRVLRVHDRSTLCNPNYPRPYDAYSSV